MPNGGGGEYDARSEQPYYPRPPQRHPHPSQHAPSHHQQQQHHHHHGGVSGSYYAAHRRSDSGGSQNWQRSEDEYPAPPLPALTGTRTSAAPYASPYRSASRPSNAVPHSSVTRSPHMSYARPSSYGYNDEYARDYVDERRYADEQQPYPYSGRMHAAGQPSLREEESRMYGGRVGHSAHATDDHRWSSYGEDLRGSSGMREQQPASQPVSISWPACIMDR